MINPAFSLSICATKLTALGFCTRWVICSFVNASVVKHSLSISQSVSKSLTVACCIVMDNYV